MKPQLFIGPANSGKTSTAKLIASQLNENKTVWVDAKTLESPEKKDLYSYMNEVICYPNTELIIIDDASLGFDYYELMMGWQREWDLDGCNYEVKGVKFPLWRSGKGVFEYLIPRVIVTSRSVSGILLKSPLFQNCFEIVEFPLQNNLQKFKETCR